MKFNGFNLLSPSLQADEAHLSVVDKVVVGIPIPGSRGKSLRVGTDIGLIGALGLTPFENDTTVHSTDWNLALKFANNSSQAVTIESLQITLHGKGNLQLVSDPDLISFQELPLEQTVIPAKMLRNHKNLLPILLAGTSEISYWVSTTLRLHQKLKLKKPRFIAINVADIQEPETYRHYFHTCDLVLGTSVGELQIRFRLPLFVGDTLRIPSPQ